MKAGFAACVLLISASAASAADLPVYTEPQAYIAPAVFSWTGFYVGAAVGYGVGRSDANATIETEDGEVEVPDIDIAIGDWHSSGGLVGAFAGYQWQMGSFVFGGQLDAMFSGIDGEDRLTIDAGPNHVEAALTTDLNWLVEARLKGGIAFDRALFYVIGGLAFADVENGIEFESPGTSREWSAADTDLGWTIGGGLQYALTDSIIIGVEYQHVFGLDNTVDVVEDETRVPVHFDNDFDIVTASIAFKF